MDTGHLLNHILKEGPFRAQDQIGPGKDVRYKVHLPNDELKHQQNLPLRPAEDPLINRVEQR